MLFNGSKNKLSVYKKKNADLHFEINGMDVLHVRKLYIWESTTNKYEMVFNGIKKCNCSGNKFMSEFD